MHPTIKEKQKNYNHKIKSSDEQPKPLTYFGLNRLEKYDFITKIQL